LQLITRQKAGLGHERLMRAGSSAQPTGLRCRGGL